MYFFHETRGEKRFLQRISSLPVFLTSDARRLSLSSTRRLFWPDEEVLKLPLDVAVSIADVAIVQAELSAALSTDCKEWLTSRASFSPTYFAKTVIKAIESHATADIFYFGSL